jgi:transcriptional regulator of aroF, aroG, tyrA and aromatic amino acid transport
LSINEFYRLEVTGKDEVGSAVGILNKIYRFDINLNSVEVSPGKVRIKIKNTSYDRNESIKRELLGLDGVISINEIKLMQFEKDEKKIHAIINSVDDGIIYINGKMEIEVFNSYCEELFHYKKEEVAGKNIKDFNFISDAILESIQKGERYDNVEVDMEGKKRNIHFLATGRPVKDGKDNIIGAVVSIRSAEEAIQIANVISSSEKGAFIEVVGNSFAIKSVKELCISVAKSNSTILLRGESGTGKEIFAKAIQNLSNRQDKKFVTLNCAAIPETLIESEMFGYEKGSFTGASSEGKEGIFKEAHEGTLFLDEIGELSMTFQAKLLRVLQEGVVRKIGGKREEKVDVRIIAATNRDLEEMVEKGEFREDLYYRLNIIPVFIPALRERLDDISTLVAFFIHNLNNRLNKRILGADAAFINTLMEYSWPGNVRELQNVVERAMNLCSSDILTLEHLIIGFNNRSKRPITKIPKFSYEEDLDLKKTIEMYEKEVITNSLKIHKTYRKTAKALGISHTSIINKVKKFDIQV